MKLNELGFDFSNLQTCQLKKKNTTLGLVMIILSVCFMPIAIIFLVLFLNQVPMEINGVMSNYGDPEYMSFFYIFVGIFLSLGILFLIIALANILGAPKTYMFLIRDTTNYDKVYYIYDKRKKEEIYLTDKYAVSYQYRYNTTYHESNPNVIADLVEKYVFWNSFEKIKEYKVKTKKNGTVLKFKDEKRTRYGARLIRKYVFSNDINIVPVKVTETVTTGGSSRNYQSQNTFYFENVNRSQHFRIHPEIKKVLNDLSQTI